MPIDLYRLEKIWEGIIKPNIHLLAYDLILTITEYMKNIYIIFDKKNTEKYDAFSEARSSIEKHEQDQYSENIYFLIDIARDTLDYYILNNTAMFDSIINIWSDSNVNVLERLSIYGMLRAQHINSNSKVDWLIERNWLYKSGAKKEIFDLVKFTYPFLSPKIRNKLIMEILTSNTNDNKDLKEYQIYNFLIYLNNAFSDDKKILAELKKIMKRNPTFKPREHPELNSWWYSGDYDEIRSPKSKKELLCEDPASLVEWLLKFKNADATELNWSDLLREITEAARDNKPYYEWSIKLINELEKRKVLHSNIFESILQGMEKETISQELLVKILNLIIENYCNFDKKGKKQISWFLLGQIGHNKDIIKSIGIKIIFEGLKYIYSFHKSDDITIDIENASDNLIYPNYTVAGNVMMSIFGLFAVIMEEDKKLESSVVNILFDFIEEVAFDDSLFSLNAKPIIAIDYAFINYYRPDLADKMVALFDMNINKEHARAMWKGFLYRGKYNDGIIIKLFYDFKKLFKLISTEEEQFIKAFCHKVVGIAIYCETNNTRDKTWLLEMIDSVTEDARETFADAFQQELFRLDAIKTYKLWDDWIRDYWDKRNNNIPVKLSQKEINKMMHWVSHFDVYFDEAVEFITKNYIPFNNYILFDLENEERDLINKHPNGVAKYFYHLLKDLSLDNSMYDMYTISEFSKKILKSIIDNEIRNKIEQELVRLDIKYR